MTFTDEPFDLEGLPPPPPPVVKKSVTTKSGVAWSRYRGAKPYHCDTCLAEVHEQWPHGTHAPNDAVYKRVTASETLYLCGVHGTELKAADERTRPQRGKK